MSHSPIGRCAFFPYAALFTTMSQSRSAHALRVLRVPVLILGEHLHAAERVTVELRSYRGLFRSRGRAVPPLAKLEAMERPFLGGAGHNRNPAFMSLGRTCLGSQILLRLTIAGPRGPRIARS